jgi:hypothetical protein
MTIVDCAELEYKNNFLKKNLGSKVRNGTPAFAKPLTIIVR